MSKHLSANQTVELLNSVKSTVREFVGREESLNRDLQTRIAAAEHRLKKELENQEAQLAGQLDQIEASHNNAKLSLESKHSRRKSLIQQAYQSSKRQIGEQIDNREGRKKYEVQRSTLDAERHRAERLQQNDSALQEFTQELNSAREVASQLEQQAGKAFRGYPAFRGLLAVSEKSAENGFSEDEHQLLDRLRQLQAQTAGDLAGFSKFLLARIFRTLRLGTWIVFCVVAATGLVLVLKNYGITGVSGRQVVGTAAGILALLIGGYFHSKRKAAPLARVIAKSLEDSRRMHDACLQKARTRHKSEIERLELEFKNRTAVLQQEWRAALAEGAAARQDLPAQTEEKRRRIALKNEQLHQSKLEAANANYVAAIERLKIQTEARKRTFTETHKANLGSFRSDHDARWQKLVAEWNAGIQPLYSAIRSANAAAEQQFPPWRPSIWENWTPPEAFINAAKLGRLRVDLKDLAEMLPCDSRLAVPDSSAVSLPLALVYPQQGSLLFETAKSGNEPAIAAINNIIFRLLATSPAGKLSFTLVDPVKLGQSFATVMHLADYEENLIKGRIWTQPAQIEERLAELNEHMEKVIQMYLRNEYETIAEYNHQAGNVAEKYHFVVIADFPANFTDAAVRRLLRIAASGARCGVYTLIHWDHRHTAPADFFPEDLRKSSVCIQLAEGQFLLANPAAGWAKLHLDPPPDPAFATEFLRKVGEKSRGSNRVEVPFAQVAPAEAEIWTLDTTDEVRIPIGVAGATKLQCLAIGKGTRQHALIAGKTGSGKSTLFHVIITNAALWCSPAQIEFYLVDFKKGVEFKGYAVHQLPHARVVAIESDREFGLSVLQRLDEELKRRGELFRKMGSQDLAGYIRAGGRGPIPRCFLIIDEFQEFFVEDDRISQAAAVLLDRIVRQGRAFGIHALLGSQTLGGAYTLARTTLGQMVIRIALQCNEADAYLIMDENNAAPRLLSRPGEGIYNDMAGAVEGNSPFQTVWLSDEERSAWLRCVHARAGALHADFPRPIVFEGNAPADVSENAPLRALLGADSVIKPAAARIWLGAPNSIKGPTEAVFEMRSGNNLLVVGQRDEAVLAILTLGLISLAAQFPRGSVRFVLFDSDLPGSPERTFLDRVLNAIPHELVFAAGRDTGSVMNDLADDLKHRADNERTDKPATFLIMRGLQNFKKFRFEDDFSFSVSSDDADSNAAAQLGRIATEGPSHGIHVIAFVDTFNNVSRFLGRKTLSEFEMRVLFQMSANDSASLCDDPNASTLGLHRALFFNEQEGYLETFRPYAIPGNDWMDNAARQLARLHGLAARPGGN